MSQNLGAQLILVSCEFSDCHCCLGVTNINESFYLLTLLTTNKISVLLSSIVVNRCGAFVKKACLRDVLSYDASIVKR